MVKNLPEMQETQVQTLGWENPLEKGMAIHASILAWRIPWTEESGRLQSTGSQWVGHGWATNCYHYSVLVSIKLHHSVSPPTQVFQLLCSLVSVNLWFFFDTSHHDWCEMLTPLWFWFAFLWWQVILSIFFHIHAGHKAIILSEMSQSQKDKYNMILLIWST